MRSSLASFGISSKLSNLTRKLITNSDGPIKSQNIPKVQFSMKYKYFFIYCGILGICYIILGVILFVQKQAIGRYEIDYTNCKKIGTTDVYCYNELSLGDLNENCVCEFVISIEKTADSQTNLIYQLDKFYQGYAYYSKSYNELQLSGGEPSLSSAKHCEYGLTKEQLETIPVNKIYPCGLVANSLFNDTFELSYDTDKIVELTKEGIVTSSFVYKFNPITTPSNNTLKPSNWPKSIFEMGSSPNNGVKDWDFLAWMMIQPFGVVKKLYAKVKPNNNNNKYGVLQPNNYTIKINYNYPAYFGNQLIYSKKLIITNVNLPGNISPHFLRFFLVTGPILMATCIIGSIYLLYSRNNSRVIPMFVPDYYTINSIL